MHETAASLLVDCKNGLGEGIQWNPSRQRVYWTDIPGNTMYSCDEAGADLHRLPLDAALCSFAFAESGRLLAAFEDGLCWLDLDTGARELFALYQPDLPHTRTNDGNLDRQGRFVVGGVETEAMAPVTPVWSVTPEGQRVILSEIGCANSIAFSPEGDTMYVCDTAHFEIFAYDYDTTTGTPTNRRVFAGVGPDGGKPDGSTVDADGTLWNSRFGGWIVQGFAPDGRRSTQVRLPVPNPTCVAIGGRNMDRMFITTARIGMDAAQLEAHPGAGGLFVAEPGVNGLAHGLYRDL